MATEEQVKQIVKAHAAGDDALMKTTVLQIAAHEARLGHSDLALELKKMVDGIDGSRRIAVQAAAAGRWLSVSKVTHSLSELIAPEGIRSRIQRILLEYRNRQKLSSHGLNSRRKILLEGEPGTGKSLTAAILASELHIPLYTVWMGLLVSENEAETDARMGQVLGAMQSSTGVYLFTGCERLDDVRCPHSGGWSKRWLPILLNEDASQSILVAEWDGRPRLDRELIRKFDEVLTYRLPTEAEIRQLLECKMRDYQEDFAASADLIQAAMGLSHGEIVRASNETGKEHILSGEPVSEELLYMLLLERRDAESWWREQAQ